MGDNVNITQGSGTTIAADDIGGVKHQRVKISVGVDGSAGDMSAGAGTTDATTPRVNLASDSAGILSAGTVASPSSQIVSTQEPRVASSSLTSNTPSASNATLLATNAARLGVIATNLSTNATAYIKYGATATLTSFTEKVAPGGRWRMDEPMFTGQIDIIWDVAGDGTLKVTEL